MIKLDSIINNSNIRKTWYGDEWHYVITDIIAEMRCTDTRNARNYYHVLKNRFKKNNIEIPDLMQIKIMASDNKSYLTDFTTIRGIKMLISFLQPNIRNTHLRVNVRKDDEVQIFHPKVISALECGGLSVENHIQLPSGSVIDIVATYEDKTYIIECKPKLTRTKLQQAIGQVLCYMCEYDEMAIPVIASYYNEFDEYAQQCCEKLGIKTLEIVKIPSQLKKQ